MRILIAEDTAPSRVMLTTILKRWGYEIVATGDGAEAWQVLQRPDAPRLAILDWMMPQMDGPEVCRKVRSQHTEGYVYLILLTARGQKEDIVKGLEAGADDYVTKPFDAAALRARLQVGERILTLETALVQKVREQQEALAQVKQLQGLLPICMHCKKIRDDRDTWHKLETYIEQNSGAMFSHSLCDACLEEFYPKEETDAG
jgi:DNA-binding response OmpR family regulator